MTRADPHPTPALDRVRRALAVRPPRQSTDYDLAPDILAALPTGRKLRPAAVLVPLIERSGDLSVVLTRRSVVLKHHPGQIAFPGGKVDDEDGSSEAAALREAWEEVGLRADDVTLIGRLDTHETVTGFAVTPVIGLVSPEFRPDPHDAEVAEVFEVPLNFLLDPANLQVHGRQWMGRKRHYFAIPYGPYYVWGATARILKGLSDRMAEAGG